MIKIAILGCGYVGTRLARQYLARGDAVTGIVRSAESLARLEAAGVPARRFDPLHDDPQPGMLEGACVLHLAPPAGDGVRDELTRSLIERLDRAGQPRRMLYMSTTGVYGDCRGEWIDETWPADPLADRSRRRLDAEEELRRWSRDTGGELIVLRVAGIYGPDRLPLERLRREVPMVRSREAPYSNRIHVEDLVTVCMAAMERAPAGTLLNVSDGHPSTMTDYFLKLADVFGLPRPPLIGMDQASEHLSAGMMTYMSESRRLSIRKLREVLGIELRYPTLDDGLRGIREGADSG